MEKKIVAGFGNMCIRIPIAGQYRGPRGCSWQGTDVVFRPLQFLIDRKAGVKQWRPSA